MTTDVPDDSAGAIGARREFHAGKRKWSWVFVIAMVFVALGVWMIVAENTIFGWIATGFFAAVALVAGLQLVGAGSRLVLERDRFELTNFGRRTPERWDEVANFAVYRVSGQEFVGYDRARDVETHQGAMNRAISGRSASLPDSFGLEPEALAALMNAYREAAVAHSWAETDRAVDRVREQLKNEIAERDGTARLIDLTAKDGSEALPEDWPLWPTFLVIEPGKPLDSEPPPDVYLCIDVLNPGSRWVPLADKRAQAFGDLRAAELRIIDPVMGEMQ